MCEIEKMTTDVVQIFYKKNVSLKQNKKKLGSAGILTMLSWTAAN